MTRDGRCDGWVRALNGQVVVFTGKVLVDDEWVTQAECGDLVERRQGEWRVNPSGAVTLVVHGDLAAAANQVVDPKRGYSEKLVFAQNERRRGHHVHVVDAAGFSDLLHRRPARCRGLRRERTSILVVADPVDRVLAEAFDPRSPPPRREKKSSPRLTIDLAALDRATAAHERTVRALAKALSSLGVTARLPPRRGPQFDLGWKRGRRVFIAEAKSLTGTDEVQQIRLAFGQVLDYTTQLAQRQFNAQPVVVLEKRPRSDRWHELADSTGVLLDYAPKFEVVTS